jgi:hypothetical protein
MGSLKAGIFFFQPFVLKQKVEPKIQGRFKRGQSLRSTVVSVNRPLPTTLNWLGPTEQVFSSCYATTQEALYSPAAAGRDFPEPIGNFEVLSLCGPLSRTCGTLCV